jgi:hypothetical protein
MLAQRSGTRLRRRRSISLHPVRHSQGASHETTVPSIRFARAGGRNRSHSAADSTIGTTAIRHQSEPDKASIRHEQRNKQSRQADADEKLHNADASRQSGCGRERRKRLLQEASGKLLVPSAPAGLIAAIAIRAAGVQRLRCGAGLSVAWSVDVDQ